MGTRRTLQTIAVMTACFLTTQVAQAANYIGYTGKSWSNDYGVLAGNCQTEAFGETAPDNKSADMAAYLLVEPNFQKTFPESPAQANQQVDSLCFGHTLELVPTGKSVHWKNPSTGSDVFLTPGKQSDNCRTFNGVKVSDGKKQKFSGVACSDQPGQWKIVR